MHKLSRLVYTSFMAPDADDSCLDPIVRQSRLNNRKLDITGFLIFDGLRFCQYLEGPADTVFRLLDKIRGDPRHVEVAVKEIVENNNPRFCAEWPMAFAIAHADDSAKDALTNAVDAIQRVNSRTDGSAIADALSLLPTLLVQT